MATATVKYNLNSAVPGGEKKAKTISYYGTISVSAASDTYATSGLAALTGFALKNLGPFADRIPLEMRIFSLAGTGVSYNYVNSSGLLLIRGGGGSGTAAPVEITNGTALSGTTPAISTDVISFILIVPAV